MTIRTLGRTFFTFVVAAAFLWITFYLARWNHALFWVKLVTGTGIGAFLALFALSLLTNRSFDKAEETDREASPKESVEAERPYSEYNATAVLSQLKNMEMSVLYPSVDIVLERMKVFETEVLRELHTIPTRTGVGFTATAAVIGGILTARDTLFWNFHLNWSMAPSFFGLEMALILFSFLAFSLAFSPSNPTIGPDITDSALVQQILQSEVTNTKLKLIETITESYNKNKVKISRAARFSTWGFLLLLEAIS